MNKIILPPIIFGEQVEGAINRLKDEGTLEQSTPDLRTQSTQEFYVIPGVSYRNQVHTAHLKKELLPSMTQAQAAKYTEQAKTKGDFYVGDMPLYHAIFASLANKSDANSEQAKVFIKQQMRNNWLLTLTRISYQPRGKDIITHNYNTNEQYQTQAQIVAPDRFIEQADKETLEALIGEGDITKINSVYQAMNQTNAFIWRLDNRPSQVIEKVARFCADSGRADFDGDGDPASRILRSGYV